MAAARKAMILKIILLALLQVNFRFGSFASDQRSQRFGGMSGTQNSISRRLRYVLTGLASANAIIEGAIR